MKAYRILLEALKDKGRVGLAKVSITGQAAAGDPPGQGRHPGDGDDVLAG